MIRKFKPWNWIEIGVAYGGSPVLILNAIKDYPDSKLISIDLFTSKNNKTIWYFIKKIFHELTNKWKLFVGKMPHIILS